jgi:hypothetical protein
VDGVAPGGGSLHGQRRDLVVEWGLRSTEAQCTRTASSVAGLGLIGVDAVGSSGGAQARKIGESRE